MDANRKPPSRPERGAAARKKLGGDGAYIRVALGRLDDTVSDLQLLRIATPHATALARVTARIAALGDDLREALDAESSREQQGYLKAGSDTDPPASSAIQRALEQAKFMAKAQAVIDEMTILREDMASMAPIRLDPAVPTDPREL